MLVLHTTGRKSGQEWSHTLQCLPDGADHVIVASNHGQDHHPGWYHNLLGDPQVSLQVGRRQLTALAVVAGPEESARLWPRLIAQNLLWEAYAKRTTRNLPHPY